MYNYNFGNDPIVRMYSEVEYNKNCKILREQTKLHDAASPRNFKRGSKAVT